MKRDWVHDVSGALGTCCRVEGRRGVKDLVVLVVVEMSRTQEMRFLQARVVHTSATAFNANELLHVGRAVAEQREELGG